MRFQLKHQNKVTIDQIRRQQSMYTSRRDYVNKRQGIPKGQSKKDNAEKLEAYGTQDEDKQDKTTTRYVLDTITPNHHTLD
jgi:hypothetical protein